MYYSLLSQLYYKAVRKHYILHNFLRTVFYYYGCYSYHRFQRYISYLFCLLTCSQFIYFVNNVTIYYDFKFILKFYIIFNIIIILTLYIYFPLLFLKFSILSLREILFLYALLKLFSFSITNIMLPKQRYSLLVQLIFYLLLPSFWSKQITTKLLVQCGRQNFVRKNFTPVFQYHIPKYVT